MTTDRARDGLAGRRLVSAWVGPLLAVRVLQVVLWLLVVSGPVAAVLVTARVSALAGRLETLDSGAAVEVPPETAGVEGFAELFVAAYLGAGEDSATALRPFLDGPSLDVVEGSWRAARTTSLGARQVGPGYFAVTVAADVIAADIDSDGQAVWVPVGTRFYSVGVVETEAGWAVTGLPMLVAAPARAVSPELLVGRFDGLDGAPGLEEMVSRFLVAYLAGVGELARYTSPSSQIVAVQPPPFVDVEVLEAGLVDASDGVGQVRVVVRAADAAGRAQVLEYSLIVTVRDGRWEVAELLPAPPLAP